MKRTRTGALLLAALLAACDGTPKTASNAVRAIPVTRTIVLPAEQAPNPEAATNQAALTLSAGAADELPQGPSGFDILPDGGFLVTDPLRERLVNYDASGAFRWQLPIQYRAERVRVLDNGDLETVNAVDSRRYIHVRDARGNYGPPQPAPAGQAGRAETDAGEAKLNNGAHGTITDLPGSSPAGAPLQVFFEAPARQMVSLRRIGRDTQGNSYVAIESGAAGSTVDIETLIRKHAPDGRAVAEIQGIARDAAVQPVEAFRQREGVVCQMAPYPTGVRIQVWDTNAAR